MKGTTLCVWRNVTCCRSVTNVRLHFQCHYIIVRQRFMLGKSAVHHIGLDRKSSRKYWNYVLGNMNMTVNLWYINLSDERTNMNEWTSNSFFPAIPIQWHHEQVVQQRKSLYVKICCAHYLHTRAVRKVRGQVPIFLKNNLFFKNVSDTCIP